MHRYLLGSIAVLMSCSPAWAGDLMNIEFLQSQAKKNNPEIQSLTQHLNDFLYSHPPNKKEFMVNTVSNVIFTSTYYISNIALMRGLGTLAGGMFYAPYAVNYVRGKKSNTDIQQSLQKLSTVSAKIDSDIQRYYPELKEGSPSAREELVKLTREAAVQEVEGNIRVEAYTLRNIVNEREGKVIGSK